MRIICDHCGHTVSGTIKRAPGNLNVHPECLTQAGEATPELTAVSWRSGDSYISMLLERTGAEPALFRASLADARRR